jgi:GAF domain-containing protein
MTPHTDIGALGEAFVSLADSLRSGYDVLDIVHELAKAAIAFTGAIDAGVVLVTAEGKFQVAAATSFRARDTDAVQRHADRGPSLASIRSGEPVAVPDIAATLGDWPQFALAADNHGFRAAHAVPLRVRGTTLGALSLYFDQPRPVSASDSAVLIALAHVTAIGIVQHRTISTNRNLSEQMRSALGSRVVIEQAKGFLAHEHKISVDDAFLLLRDHARRNGTGLREIAEQVVARHLSLG